MPALAIGDEGWWSDVLGELVVSTELREVRVVVEVHGFENLCECFAQNLLLVAEGVLGVDDIVLDLVRVAGIGDLVHVIDVFGAFAACLWVGDLLCALVGIDLAAVVAREAMQAECLRFCKSCFVHIIYYLGMLYCRRIISSSSESE